uniref:Uncharacterized protein n=1 Tax=Arundo donax TaxID=35708 RepID=A0A0A9GLR6_ARUDO
MQHLSSIEVHNFINDINGYELFVIH